MLTPIDNAAVTQASLSGELSILQQEKKTAKPFGSDDLGKDQFLQLLVTSLRYQDPLDPSSNEEFISQMAQFSALENSRNTNASIERLAAGLENMVTQQNAASQTFSDASATNLLGKKVRVADEEVHFNGGEPVEFDVHVTRPNALVSIVNGEGMAINTFPLIQTGDDTVTWDGSLPDGQRAPSGTYTIKVTDSTGAREAGFKYVEDTIQGLTYDSSGVLLDVAGGQYPMDKVRQVFDNVPDVTDG